jgi:hypothetical protein
MPQRPARTMAHAYRKWGRPPPPFTVGGRHTRLRHRPLDTGDIRAQIGPRDSPLMSLACSTTTGLFGRQERCRSTCYYR